jgi:hypothetical protein
MILSHDEHAIPLTPPSYRSKDYTIGGLDQAMAFVSIANALMAWTEHFGWTATPEKTVPATLFGLAAAFKIRPVEAGLHDAARALRRAFIPDRRSTDTEASGRDILAEPTIAHDTESSAADALVPDASAPNPEVIAPESRDGMAAALREAFEAGKAHKAQELKAMMAAFLDALVSGHEASRTERLRAPSLDSVAAEVDPRTNGSAERTRSADPDLGDAG